MGKPKGTRRKTVLNSEQNADFSHILCVCQVNYVVLHRNVMVVKFIAVKFYEEVL